VFILGNNGKNYQIGRGRWRCKNERI